MHSGVLGSIGVISVMAMTVMRKVLHKPIFKVFIHTLREVNPGVLCICQHVVLARGLGETRTTVKDTKDMLCRSCPAFGDHAAASSCVIRSVIAIKTAATAAHAAAPWTRMAVAEQRAPHLTRL